MFEMEYNKNHKGHMSITDEGVRNMPRKDQTGLLGLGATSERGLGYCDGAKSVRNVIGLGLGLGYKRGRVNFGADPKVSETQKGLLQEQKESLESRLDSINKQLES
jgi:hypothetical protein